MVGLVAFASHLEDRAITRARESMQGGLDRIPRGARIVNPIQGISLGSSISFKSPQILPHGELARLCRSSSGRGHGRGTIREVVPVDGIIVSGGGL